MSLDLLIDADEFWSAAAADIARAQQRVWIQTLSLEADSAGLPLADALINTSASDKRLLVDAFSQHIINDRFIYAPGNAFDRALRAEVRGTREMLANLKRNRVQIGVTNPAGFLWHRLPSRDHRKFVLIDDRIAYIGGINFSEHNFAWHDLMIRIDDPQMAAFLRADYEATWDGKPVNAVGKFEGVELHNLSGHGNEAMTEATLDVIRGAKRSILAITPYLTFPFTDAMAEARSNGARVTVISPKINNRVSHRRYVHRLAKRHGFELRHYHGRMSHLKAMLIDDECVIAGSTNFDWPTYHVLAETIALIRDRNFVEKFIARVTKPDLEKSSAVEANGKALGGRYGELQHRIWAWGARTMCRPHPEKRIVRL